MTKLFLIVLKWLLYIATNFLLLVALVTNEWGLAVFFVLLDVLYLYLRHAKRKNLYEDARIEKEAARTFLKASQRKPEQTININITNKE